MNIRGILKLIRVKHYIKNLVLIIPLFFSGNLTDVIRLKNGLLGIVAFCFAASLIYVLNDLVDREKDRAHPTKCQRPLASGEITVQSAIILEVILFGLLIVSLLFLGNSTAWLLLFLYLGVNLFYCIKGKNIPIIDYTILASGYSIRLFFGGAICDVSISHWLFLVVLFGSLFMGLGKRRGEIAGQADTRDVLKKYNEEFLIGNMYMCLALMIVFYSLWALEMYSGLLIWTVPLVTLMAMRYSLDLQYRTDGDPIEIVLGDKVLLCVFVAYVVILILLIYPIR